MKSELALSTKRNLVTPSPQGGTPGADFDKESPEDFHRITSNLGIGS